MSYKRLTVTIPTTLLVSIG